jgi:hypothetical protein
MDTAFKKDCDPKWDRLGFIGGIAFIVSTAALCIGIMLAMTGVSLFFSIHEWLTNLRERFAKPRKQDTI